MQCNKTCKCTPSLHLSLVHKRVSMFLMINFSNWFQVDKLKSLAAFTNHSKTCRKSGFWNWATSWKFLHDSHSMCRVYLCSHPVIRYHNRTVMILCGIEYKLYNIILFMESESNLHTVALLSSHLSLKVLYTTGHIYLHIVLYAIHSKHFIDPTPTTTANLKTAIN